MGNGDTGSSVSTPFDLEHVMSDPYACVAMESATCVAAPPPLSLGGDAPPVVVLSTLGLTGGNICAVLTSLRVHVAVTAATAVVEMRAAFRIPAGAPSTGWTVRVPHDDDADITECAVCGAGLQSQHLLVAETIHGVTESTYVPCVTTIPVMGDLADGTTVDVSIQYLQALAWDRASGTYSMRVPLGERTPVYDGFLPPLHRMEDVARVSGSFALPKADLDNGCGIPLHMLAGTRTRFRGGAAWRGRDCHVVLRMRNAVPFAVYYHRLLLPSGMGASPARDEGSREEDGGPPCVGVLPEAAMERGVEHGVVVVQPPCPAANIDPAAVGGGDDVLEISCAAAAAAGAATPPGAPRAFFFVVHTTSAPAANVVSALDTALAALRPPNPATGFPGDAFGITVGTTRRELAAATPEAVAIAMDFAAVATRSISDDDDSPPSIRWELDHLSSRACAPGSGGGDNYVVLITNRTSDRDAEVVRDFRKGHGEGGPRVLALGLGCDCPTAFLRSLTQWCGGHTVVVRRDGDETAVVRGLSRLMDATIDMVFSSVAVSTDVNANHVFAPPRLTTGSPLIVHTSRRASSVSSAPDAGALEGVHLACLTPGATAPTHGHARPTAAPTTTPLLKMHAQNTLPDIVARVWYQQHAPAGERDRKRLEDTVTRAVELSIAASVPCVYTRAYMIPLGNSHVVPIGGAGIDFSAERRSNNTRAAAYAKSWGGAGSNLAPVGCSAGCLAFGGLIATLALVAAMSRAATLFRAPPVENMDWHSGPTTGHSTYAGGSGGNAAADGCCDCLFYGCLMTDCCNGCGGCDCSCNVC